ncbi:hypothetical protein QEJ31_13545 [Pigmentibacter sp. JX0631]|uniref:hypothetical protein n=1 Tax=Pigmentibacter sp. JX0631 TaxID=2976982 RepID=UPI002468CBB9|nr:hypothetical protein [Pigmentibacter sp. JX0631]WGL59549.1 hypothetical protein QEJ31_13545 [Pigmentibacter sp. JX0631]
MPFLILPPTIMISENPEIPIAIKKKAIDYQDSLLQQLGIVKTQEKFNLQKGAYRGLRVFDWNQEYDAYLATYFLFNVGKQQKQEYLQGASVVRYKDCLQIGAIWKFSEKIAPISFPDSLVPLSTVVKRSFSNIAPVKINSFYDFRSEDRMENLLDLYLGEKLSAKGILNITNLSRIVCKGNYQEQLKSPENVDFPGKALNLVKITFKSEYNEKKKDWPKVTILSQLNSGVFAQKNKDLFNDDKPQLFNPETISDNLVNKLLPELHDLSKEEFKVIRRYRGWIYLDKGRGFGLQIGMRLIGPENAKIHIIRYLPQVNGEIDSCIAFIRYEDDKRPVKVGDMLKIDPTIFPKKMNSK